VGITEEFETCGGNVCIAENTVNKINNPEYITPTVIIFFIQCSGGSKKIFVNYNQYCNPVVYFPISCETEYALDTFIITVMYPSRVTPPGIQLDMLYHPVGYVQ
ncbi:MAG: hypothetical protein WC015_08215, partial [Methanoregula sp.]